MNILRAALLCICLQQLVSTALAQPAHWHSRGIGGGGALYAPSFSPHNSKELYLNCDMGDVFHTTNLGKVWETVDFRKLQSSTLNKIQFTSDSLIMYASGGGPGGIGKPVKSTDAGATWKPLGSDPTNGRMYTIIADPLNPDRLVVSGFTQVFYSNNGGASFTIVPTSGNNLTGCRVAGAFFDGSNVFIATKAGLYYSTNAASPSPVFQLSPLTGLSGGESMFAFAGVKQNNVTRFYCLAFDSAKVRPGYQPNAYYSGFQNFYRLDWGSAGWTQLTSTLTNGILPGFVELVKDDINTVFLCGEGADGFGRRVFTVLTSSDAGASWHSILDTENNGNILTAWGGFNGDIGWGWWSCPTGFDVAPDDPTRIAISDFGWIHVTTNGGASWKQIYSDTTVYHQAGSPTPMHEYYATSGLEPTCAYWMTWIDSLSMIASLADLSALRSTDGGQKWSFDYIGLSMKKLNDVSIVVRHPRTGVLYAAQGEVTGANGQYDDNRLSQSPGRVMFSTDDGKSWQVMRDFGHPVQNIATDPLNPDRMFASVSDVPSGAGGVYYCADNAQGAASAWTKLSAPPRTEGRAKEITVLRNGHLISVYGARDQGGWQYTPSSGVFYSSDNGITWTDRTANGMKYRTISVAIDPNDATQSTWLATVGSGGASGQPGLYRTTNKGSAWIRLYDQPCWTVTFHPQNPSVLYLCTDQNGLLYSTNANNALPQFVQIPSFNFKTPMRVFFNPFNSGEVWVMTFGNGMRVGYDNTIPVELSSFNASLDGNAVRLQWTTATETNNFGFEIQRTSSITSNNTAVDRTSLWESIGFVPGNQTATAAHSYTFTDLHPQGPMEYYRLKQMDLDGSVTFSPIVEVRIPIPATMELMQNYPNPFNGRTIIEIIVSLEVLAAGVDSDGSRNLSLAVYDVFGREVAVLFNGIANPGRYHYSFDAAGLPAGQYVYTLTSEGKRTARLMTVVR